MDCFEQPQDEQPRRQGERHHEQSYVRAKLEVAVLTYLDDFGPVELLMVMGAFRLTRPEAHKLIDNLRQAEVVVFNPASAMCALAPA